MCCYMKTWKHEGHVLIHHKVDPANTNRLARLCYSHSNGKDIRKKVEAHEAFLGLHSTPPHYHFCLLPLAKVKSQSGEIKSLKLRHKYVNSRRGEDFGGNLSFYHSN